MFASTAKWWRRLAKLWRRSSKRGTRVGSTCCLLLLLTVSAYAQHGPWVADRGDNTYRNPILYADYSDPDVIRVGDDFYMTASSFDAVPGLPILHSKDLVNWDLIGHALRRQRPDVYDKTQ